jgi:hypothetical protein
MNVDRSRELRESCQRAIDQGWVRDRFEREMHERLSLLETRQDPITEEMAAELWPDDPDYLPTKEL